MPLSLFLNKWVLGALVFAGLGIALWLQTERLSAAQDARDAAQLVAKQWEANFDQVAKVNAENIEALAKLKAENARIDGIVADAAAKYNRLGKAYEKLKGQAYADQAPVTDDWCAILDGLRGQQGGTGPACSR